MNEACLAIGLVVSALLAGCATATVPAAAPTTAEAPVASAGPATPTRTRMPLPKGVFFGDEVDVLPKVIHKTEPEYPHIMAKHGISGKLVVVFFVLADGSVANARTRYTSRMEFELPAHECVRKWRFEPAIKDDVPVACQLEVLMTFSTQGQ